ncbi:homoserine dehydrogenase [Halovulum dunhuangense]|uniref:Homoserine dehydrogenase n=1 Tax=Halovulum dunhuangense TaxID=1505036 RepID=A0A849L512_9RHOB|nr:homoserine dehydrogenase [Halovulum dunhuangense]NNU81217.1 homoserine dehydrogenase [Halovulum dunhuangense]
MTQPLRIALAGLGTVGAGMVTILQTHAELITARAGREIRLVAVSARSRTKDRGVDLSGFDWEDDPVALARRDDVDLLVEVMGGEDGTARVATETALAAGKHVVTANKAMMARHGTRLAALAEEKGVSLRYEAAVAGGIPIVKALTEGMAANGMTRVLGVMNGTCNYILTEMERTGGAYADILADAQRLGYAEADPTFDVGGFDAAQKLALLSATAFGTEVDYDAIQIEGIERVTLTDIRHAREMGYAIKLLGVAALTPDGVEQRMQPCLVPDHSPLGQLEGVTNMVVLEGDFIGRTVYQGPGAGAGPTASAVMADVIDIARGAKVPSFGVPARMLSAPQRSGLAAPAPYYLRLGLADRPGTLARVADALGRAGISIDRMRQIQHETDEAPVLIVTHACARADLDRALADIMTMDVTTAEPVAYRIEPV